MLQQGTLFDNRYELIKLIGRGGFAEVWLVKDTLTDLDEALKIYAPGGGMDEDGLKIFAKELAVVHELRHTNLLTPKTMSQCDHQPYLIMQYCPNGSLNKKVGGCTEDEAWKILAQVAAGLAYLHKRNIVHQDIKPDNILVDANQDCVITDFGISLKAQSTLRKSMRVQANSGTSDYMAPERFSAEPHPIPANDIWSLGAMMFELIEGDVPFAARMGGLAQMNGAKIPNMHADVSDNLKQVILSMLDVDAKKRPTAEQLVEYAKSKKAPLLPPKATTTLQEKSASISVSAPTPIIEEKKTQIINRDALPRQNETQLQQKSKANKNSASTRKWVGIICGILCITIVVIVALNTRQTSSVADDYIAVDTVVEENYVDSETGASQQLYVDLGLPSGTLWKNCNEEGYYNFHEAVKAFGDSLPTVEQLKELKNKCTWEWRKNGSVVTGPNGKSIFLPAAGYIEVGGNQYGVDTTGSYWAGDSEYAWYIYFYSGGIGMDRFASSYRSRAIRLVR